MSALSKLNAMEVPARMPVDRPVAESFRCEVEPARSTVLVRPVGDLDLSAVPAVETQLSELWSLGFTRIALDLRDTHSLDSAGLRLVLQWVALASADGFAFGVIEGPRQVQLAFTAARVGDRVPFWSTDGQAREHQRRP